jgi:hypothetical protein
MDEERNAYESSSIHIYWDIENTPNPDFPDPRKDKTKPDNWISLGRISDNITQSVRAAACWNARRYKDL